MIRAIGLFLMLGLPAFAETVVAATGIRAGTILEAHHLTISALEHPTGIAEPTEIIGLEARVNLYPNRPILSADLGAPRVVDRNEVVTLIYVQGGLNIEVAGRALEPGGIGDALKVMNLGSRRAVHGTVIAPGLIRVGDGL